MGRLQDRVAVVTGAAHGIGAAIALKLAQEGADLVIGDIDGSGLESTGASITGAGHRWRAVVGDSTEAAIAEELVETAVQALGSIDILVNNVGGTVPGKIWELPEEA